MAVFTLILILSMEWASLPTSPFASTSTGASSSPMLILSATSERWRIGLTTEAIICDKPEKEKAAPPMPPGGGYGDMY